MAAPSFTKTFNQLTILFPHNLTSPLKQFDYMKCLRKIWIGLLSSIALFSSCTCVEHPKVYGPPVKGTNDTVNLDSKRQRRHQLKQRLEALRNTIKEREGAEVYGSPEIMKRYSRETDRLRHEADSISNELELLDNE